MAENLVAEIRQMLQDLVAPDLKALLVKVDGIQKQVVLSEKSTSAQLEAFRAEFRDFRLEFTAYRVEQTEVWREIHSFRAEMRSEFQAQRNLVQNEVLRETGPIRERLAALEAQSAHG